MTHANVVVLDGVGGMAGAPAEAPRAQLLHLLSETLAEDVVDQRIVHSGALCKHAREETDFRWDIAAVPQNRPHADDGIGCPAYYKAKADEHSNLQ